MLFLTTGWRNPEPRGPPACRPAGEAGRLAASDYAEGPAGAMVEAVSSPLGANNARRHRHAMDNTRERPTRAYMAVNQSGPAGGVWLRGIVFFWSSGLPTHVHHRAGGRRRGVLGLWHSLHTPAPPTAGSASLLPHVSGSRCPATGRPTRPAATTASRLARVRPRNRWSRLEPPAPTPTTGRLCSDVC